MGKSIVVATFVRNLDPDTLDGAIAVPDHSKSMLIKVPGGAVSVDVFFQGETVWRLKRFFESWELSRKATVSKMEMVQLKGERQEAPRSTVRLSTFMGETMDTTIGRPYRDHNYI